MTFFKEYGVSERNQEIVSDYIADFRGVGRVLSEITVQNNIRIMMFVLKSISTNLDKLTRADVKQYKRALDTYKRKDRTPASKATIKHYLIGFKQFLKWTAGEYKNPTYQDLPIIFQPKSKSRRRTRLIYSLRKRLTEC